MPSTWKSTYLLDFLSHALPRVVVLDNVSIHRVQPIRETKAELAKLGIELRYLPPCPAPN